jgi:membrane protein
MGIAEKADIVWDIFRYGVCLAALFLIFILFYVYIPNCTIRFKEAVPGAVLSTLGWLILSTGFAFYVNKFESYSKIYGSIGAVIALLIWMYWSSIIIFVGSELNSILSDNNTCKKGDE